MKKLKILLMLLLINIVFIPNVLAAGSASISVAPSSRTVVVGNTFTVTVRISSTVNIGAARYSVNYDSSIVSLSSTTAPGGGASAFFETEKRGNEGIKTLSYTYTFKAKKSGNAKISVTVDQITDTGESSSVGNISVSSNSSSTIKVITQAELEATYSKNNNLSNLGIEGYELSPSFNADTTEYSVEINPETEKINVIATKADSTASIIGGGEVEVSEGLNVIKVEVTAQNGNIKTYTINATVLELDPINLNVENTNYTVVRSKKVLTFDNPLFTNSTTSINGTEVPSFYNETTDTTLIALKDAEGNIKYFKVENDSYIEYKELSLSNLYIMLLNTDETPYRYTKTTTTIDEISYDAYKSLENSRFFLLYGVNLENGNQGFYQYDNYENTLQRFDIDTLNTLQDNSNKYILLMCILGGTTCILFLIMIITSILRLNKNKKTKDVIKDIKKQVEDVPEEVREETEENIISSDETESISNKDKDIIDEMDEMLDKTLVDIKVKNRKKGK